MNGIGERVQALRKRRDMTRTALAHELGVAYNTLERWELGHNDMSYRSVGMLSDLFGVSADYLIHGDRYDSKEIEVVGMEAARHVGSVEWALACLRDFAATGGKQAKVAQSALYTSPKGSVTITRTSSGFRVTLS